MVVHNQTEHQRQQLEVIQRIQEQIQQDALSFSTVDPVEDFDKDPRLTLTSVHFPHQELIAQIQEILKPLKEISPHHYYYRPSSLHLTIKNIRVINDPPRFTEQDINTALKVFSQVIPKHKAYRTYFYRLLLFPANLALVGTTDPELDNIIHELDQELTKAGLPDDKSYINSSHFFHNITLVRFTSPLTEEFSGKLKQLSQQITLEPYLVDSVTLIKSNASLFTCKKLKTWKLKA